MLVMLLVYSSYVDVVVVALMGLLALGTYILYKPYIA